MLAQHRAVREVRGTRGSPEIAAEGTLRDPTDLLAVHGVRPKAAEPRFVRSAPRCTGGLQKGPHRAAPGSARGVKVWPSTFYSSASDLRR